MKQNIEQIPVADLRPWDRNARTHTREQLRLVEQSIREFGFTNPVLVSDDNTILAGHGRVTAARNLGMDTVPCLRLSHLDDDQRRAYVIADNRLAERAGWDYDLLRLELGALDEHDFDLDMLGFGQDDLEQIMGAPDPETMAGENDIPDPPADPETAPGDIYRLGGHYIICGSSTDSAIVDALLAMAQPPHLMVTDPPYGVEYDPEWRNRTLKNNRHSDLATGKVLNDDRDDWRDAWALFPGDVAYVWHASTRVVQVAESLMVAGFDLRAQIIWAKSQLVISRGHYHSRHEPCWYAVRRGKSAHWNGSRRRSTVWTDIDTRETGELFVRRRDLETVEVIPETATTVWDIPKPQKNETGHSTQKPVECMRRPIINNSKKGDTVYEPFAGSGTTIIACEQTGRACLAIELNPAYVDICVKRWENFTGKKAERIA